MSLSPPPSRTGPRHAPAGGLEPRQGGPAITRRSLLGGAGLLLAFGAGSAVTTGCVASGGGGNAEPAEDVVARAAAVQAELDLLAAYDAASGRFPALATALTALRAHHAEHLVAVGGASASAPPGSGPASGSVTPPASATPPRSAPPADSATPSAGASAGEPGEPKTLLDELVRLETAAATTHRDGCLTASADLAPLLASLHAAETAHVELLVGLGGSPVPSASAADAEGPR